MACNAALGHRPVSVAQLWEDLTPVARQRVNLTQGLGRLPLEGHDGGSRSTRVSPYEYSATCPVPLPPATAGEGRLHPSNMAVAGNQIIVAVSSQQFRRHAGIAATHMISRETQLSQLNTWF